jgi:prepilin-type N-terminal cleavage/methylation domain-containing protein
MKKNFSLIELLVVIAIIGILASSLLPTLSKARKSSKRAVCINNYRQIGIGVFAWSQDNDHYVMPADFGGSINSYDKALREQNYISDDYLLFLCPNDTIPPASGKRRTYVGIKNDKKAAMYDQGQDTSNYHKFTATASDTFLLGEWVYDLNRSQLSRKSDFGRPTSQYNQNLYDLPDGNLHGDNKFAYLRADGSASIVNVYSTVGNGTFDDPQGNWTRYTSD